MLESALTFVLVCIGLAVAWVPVLIMLLLAGFAIMFAGAYLLEVFDGLVRKFKKWRKS